MVQVIAFRRKRILQTVCLMSVLAYTMLLAYQYKSSDQRIKLEDLRDFSVNTLPAVAQNTEARAEEIITSADTETQNSNEILPLNVTATKKPPTLELDDIFITVKTTGRFHSTRLDVILKTWFQFAKQQTWFFTDMDDEALQNFTNGHMINTHCPPTHQIRHLGCKTSAEYNAYLESGKKWWCHFDDDNYVNVPNLVKLLKDYDPLKDWYLGKLSMRHRVQINRTIRGNKSTFEFWFGTGGAGYCLSPALGLKMSKIAGAGQFKRIVNKMSLTDDVAMGYIIEHLLKVPLTVVEQLHSHLEPLKYIRQSSLRDQVSLSYGISANVTNVVKIEGFNVTADPTRFLSLHCYLYPKEDICAGMGNYKDKGYEDDDPMGA